MSDWQPINIAPKDDAILLYSPSDGILICGWHCGRWDDGEGRPWGDDATHWMPLPEEPK